MTHFCIKIDEKTKEPYLLTSIEGKALLTSPQLNKGTAFTLQERLDFNLIGKLPYKIETLEDQVERVYHQYLTYQNNPIEQHIYLNNLHDRNHVVFYALVKKYLREMLSIIYTPVVGLAVMKFSKKFRQARGLYMSYPERDYLPQILKNRSNPEIDIVVLTDGEAVLGIGDQGIGGMDIPIAKLMVYTLCGGVNPNRTLPITIDVGTNNATLLHEPEYLGWQEKRLGDESYFDFMDKIVETISHQLPNAFIHFEDFSVAHGQALLDRYQDKYCVFNDDIQGTGATALAAVIAASHLTNTPLKDQRFVIFGAGSAGIGIADQLLDALIAEGLSEEEALEHFWLIDKMGLLQTSQSLRNGQKKYAKSPEALKKQGFENQHPISLEEAVRYIHPTVLIGTSAVSGAFTESIIQTMSKAVERPLIMPLSNPTERAEAKPIDIIHWSQGKALVATGSPFEAVEYQGQKIDIAQCNNAKIFPGIGLGAIVCRPRSLSKKMLLAAAHALAAASPVYTHPTAPLLNTLDKADEVSKKIAFALAKTAIEEGLSDFPLAQLEKTIEEKFWTPKYLPYRKG